jgi:DNA-binding MarR family transcriptional regulator
MEARWLDPEERKAWLALISVLTRLPSALDAQLQHDSGMNNFEYQVLAALSALPGRQMRISDLAQRAGGSIARVSQVISRLEGRGWVRREPDPADGRYTLAVLTTQGWDTIVAAAPGHVEQVRQLVFDPLTKAQVKQLTAIGERIVSKMDCPGDPR